MLFVISSRTFCLHSKVVTSASLNIESLFLFFSISVSISKRLLSALKASKISQFLLLRNFQDPLVSGCIPKLQTCTWKVEDAVLPCENDIKMNQVCETAVITGMGLDTPPHPKSLKAELQNITRDIYHHKSTDDTHAFTKAVQLCRFRDSEQDGRTMFSKTFLRRP